MLRSRLPRCAQALKESGHCIASFYSLYLLREAESFGAVDDGPELFLVEGHLCDYLADTIKLSFLLCGVLLLLYLAIYTHI